MTATPDWLVRGADFDQGLARSSDNIHVGLERGSMKMMLYAPRGEDTQGPHKRDEIYIVRTGAAGFLRGGERVSLAEGDTLFVPARMEHRFVDFTPDFSTWVVFWGPEGGETTEET